MIAFIDSVWYGRHKIRWFLYPLSLVYLVIISLRRAYLTWFCQKKPSVPLIVIGNLTVGGTGKTPLVIAIAQKLKAQGMSVGIVSRGYGASRATKAPYQVKHTDKPYEVGDEPLLIAQKTHCPVVIAHQRTQAVDYLIQHHAINVILSDDGLQHYRMGRTVEIAVVDGLRKLGNGMCLPAGPLRETEKRLKQVDFVVVNGTAQDAGTYSMSLEASHWIHMKSGQDIDPSTITERVAAVAAIGNPHRFYATLDAQHIQFKPYSFPDHHVFKVSDFKFCESVVVMTEKDAIKCQHFVSDSFYYVPVQAKLDTVFWDNLWQKIR